MTVSQVFMDRRIALERERERAQKTLNEIDAEIQELEKSFLFLGECFPFPADLGKAEQLQKRREAHNGRG